MNHVTHSEFAAYIGGTLINQAKSKFQYSRYPQAVVLQLIATRRYRLLRQMTLALSGRVKISRHYYMPHTLSTGEVWQLSVTTTYRVGTLLRHIAKVMDWSTNNVNVALRVHKYGIANKRDRKDIITAYLQGYDQDVAEIVKNIKGYGTETPPPKITTYTK